MASFTDDEEDSPIFKRRRLTSMPAKQKSKICPNISVVIHPDESNYPRSQVVGYKPQLPFVREHDALEEILCLWRADPDCENEDFPDIETTDFCVYRQAPTLTSTTFELVELHHIQAARGHNELFLDGILNYQGRQFHVQKLKFHTLSVGGYDTDEPSTISWIQSRYAANFKCWYHLKSPSPQYRTFFDAYHNAATFGKYFIDYIVTHPLVTFNSLREEFSLWLQDQSPYRNSPELTAWLNSSPSRDFRITAVRYVEWLWKEVSGVSAELMIHPIWSEFRVESFGSIPRQPAGVQTTTVTPFVYDCFKDMYFNSVLEQSFLSPETDTLRDKRLGNLGFAKEPIAQIQKPRHRKGQVKSIRAGQIIALNRDALSSWKGDETIWFCFVLKVIPARDPFLEVLWLYAPCDTICGHMYYPFSNELFWSNHCNCGESEIRLSHVVGVIDNIVFHPKKIPIDRYFIRQMYDMEMSCFTTLDKCNRNCSHMRDSERSFKVKNQWRIGDMVFVAQRGRLNPVVVFGFESNRVQVQSLLRRTEVDPQGDAKPNELLWNTDPTAITTVPPSQMSHKCHVKFFRATDEEPRPPPPYDRDGQGNCFIVTGFFDGNKISNLGSQSLDRKIAGPDYHLPSSHKMALRSLSLFSGGGNFDRGIEEGGAVHTTHVVEWNAIAINTFAANVRDGAKIGFFNGSVDDHLRAAIKGKTSRVVPCINHIEHISAGSPCPGFSMLQVDTESLMSLSNASKVATVAAYIDLYRPLYATFENVVSMTRPLGPNKDQNVFSQLVCALVAMGYQLRVFNLDAWSYGAAQSRSRLFISVTAPRLSAVKEPPRTHAHPPGVGNRSLGKAGNGLPFGKRQFGPTPFQTPTAEAAMQGIPELRLSSVQPFSHPDHIFNTVKPIHRSVFNTLPQQGFLKEPVNIVRTLRDTQVSPVVSKYWATQGQFRQHWLSKSYTRIRGNGLISTVTTAPNWSCGKSGYGIHWQQNRPLTLLEVRRAQGFLDHEPILGSFRDQWRIVGNSVARPVALALGIKLREAWEACPPDLIERLKSAGVFGRDRVQGLVDATDTLRNGTFVMRQKDVVQKSVTTTTTTTTSSSTRTTVEVYVPKHSTRTNLRNSTLSFDKYQRSSELSQSRIVNGSSKSMPYPEVASSPTFKIRSEAETREPEPPSSLFLVIEPERACSAFDRLGNANEYKTSSTPQLNGFFQDDRNVREGF